MSLGQYYTTELVSEHLVSHIHLNEADNVLDIGCGQASLLLAAGQRWSNASLIGFDIDPVNTISINTKLRLHHGDGFDPDLWKRIIDEFGYIDVAVSNPPYISVDLSASIRSILREVGLDSYLSSTITQVPAELVFLAQNLLTTRKGGELGIILPAGIVSGERWAGIREFLTSNFVINKCIQLPTNTFKRTEASTFALCLTNQAPIKDNVELRELLSESPIAISKGQALQRMDYFYYQGVQIFENESRLDRSVEFEMFRGNTTNKQLRSTAMFYIHTSSLSNDYPSLELPAMEIKGGVKYAQKGDILISRVGSRCIGQLAYVSTGCAPISDCVIVLRSHQSKELWSYLKQIDISVSLKKMALGVGAKYLTMTMLKRIFNASNF